MQTKTKQESVVSRDGTRIGFVRQGAGPAIVLVQGAMADVHAYRDLADELSEMFTVVRAERRGRGLSPRDYDPAHDIARDVEDVDAVMEATEARTLFGLSSGAVIVLEAARTLQRVERAIVFEPPFYADGIDRNRLRRLFQDIDHRRFGAALIGALTTAGTAPAAISRLPRWPGRLLGRIILTVQGLVPGPATSLRRLLPGVRYDFHDVAQVDGHLDAFVGITQPVLLLSGTVSPRFLQDAVRAVQRVLPHASHVKLPGLGHDGPWNDGSPGAVAAEIIAFLRDQQTDAEHRSGDAL